MSAPPTRRSPGRLLPGSSDAMVTATNPIVPPQTDMREDTRPRRVVISPHPFDSGDDQRLTDYLTGRADEREFGQDAAYLRGWADCDAEMARIQRRAVANVHAAARRPVVTPEALSLSPEEMSRLLAAREQAFAAGWRAGLRQTRRAAC